MELEKRLCNSHRKLSETLKESEQKNLLTFVGLTCHSPTLCQHSVQDFYALSHWILMSAWEVGYYFDCYFSQTRKPRHWKVRVVVCSFSRCGGAGLWTSEVWPWAQALNQNATSKNLLNFKNLVCFREGCFYVYLFMTPSQVIKGLVLRGEKSTAENRKESGKGNDCRCQVYLRAWEGSLLICVLPS